MMRRSKIRGARAFCSLPPACCRRFETSAFESLESVVQRWPTRLSGNMPDHAGRMPALPRSVLSQRLI
jgi:hypothetical protein